MVRSLSTNAVLYSGRFLKRWYTVMEMIFCPNCNKLTGYKRVIGFGTFFAVLLTAGIWLLVLPFYPKRCITCGLTKSDSVPWYKTWRLGLVLAVAVVAFGAAMSKFFPLGALRGSSIELLGFKKGLKDAGVHASAIAFRMTGCEDKGDDFKYCHYVREQDEALTLILWRDELETVDYEVGIKRYNGLFKELSSKYGTPRQSDEFPNGGNWGSHSEGAMLSLIQRADLTGGSASLHFSGGKFDDYMKTAYPLPPRPPDIPSQVLPEIKKAEQRLFGAKTADVDRLEVTSQSLQGALAMTTRCKAHFCPDHYAVWTVDLSTGEAAGALADTSEVVVYLGDYGSAEKLPPVLQSEIEQQREEGLPSPKNVRYVSHDEGQPAKVIPDSITLDESELHRIKVDAFHPENVPQFVRTIEGAWSRPTLVYTDDFIKVYWPFDDQLTLESKFPKTNWAHTSFEILLFIDIQAASPQRTAMIENLKKGGVAHPEKLRYEEERVSIDTANQKYTLIAGKTVDVIGEAFTSTPDNWRETRDLGDSQLEVLPGETRDIADAKLKLSRFITGEIVRRLTAPQRIALDALNIRSLDELRWDHEREQHYATLIEDQVRMQRSLGPAQADK